jgi:hypothetical protein
LQTFRDLAALFRQMGALRFILLFGGLCAIILAYGYVYAWLGDTIGWREDYGFTCRRKCMVQDMWHSRKLLEGGTGAELSLFALIWFIPATGAVIGLYVTARRAIARRRARIRPMWRD